jgi:hypothetical protein
LARDCKLRFTMASYDFSITLSSPLSDASLALALLPSIV